MCTYIHAYMMPMGLRMYKLYDSASTSCVVIFLSSYRFPNPTHSIDSP